MLINYPPNVQTDTAASQHAITSYQSQLIWIGNGDISGYNLVVFSLVDEETHLWKEIMSKSREIIQHRMCPISISSASEDKYLIIVISEPLLMSVLIFDGQEWRRRDGPECTAPIHGITDTIIHDGSIFLMTRLGSYEISIETILAKRDSRWKKLGTIPKKIYSNMTSFNDHIVVLAPRTNYHDNRFHILAYESVSDAWIILEELECYVSWMMPSIMGLPGGHLLILGVSSIKSSQNFNILEVTIKGKASGTHYQYSTAQMHVQLLPSESLLLPYDILTTYACMHLHVVSW